MDFIHDEIFEGFDFVIKLNSQEQNPYYQYFMSYQKWLPYLLVNQIILYTTLEYSIFYLIFNYNISENNSECIDIADFNIWHKDKKR